MATITQTTLQLYKGVDANGQKVGNDIVDTTPGGPQTITLNYETLGAHLDAGEQYFTRVKVLNDEGFESDWNNLDAQKKFKTKILAEIITISGSNGNLNVELALTYNSEVLSVQDCGVYVSKHASGTDEQRISVGDLENIGQWQIKTLEENTTYYVIPFVRDNEEREYRPEWTDAEQVNTGYKYPVVTLELNDDETTYNKIAGSFTVITNDTLSSVYLTLQASGETLYRFNQTASTGMQTFEITNGQTDSNGETVVITPNTDYTISVYATNTTEGTGSSTKTISTKPQGTSEITITSVVPSATSATVNLAYNNGE